MLVSLLDAPPEVLQKIVLFAGLDTPLGPPGELYCLLLTCRTLHCFLTLNSSKLYARVFAQKFDIKVPANRLGNALQDHANVELRRRFTALQCFRTGRVDDAFLPQAFWIAYFMMLENEGLNSMQLHWAGLPTLVNGFLQRHLYEGAVQNNGWPVENETNSLAIALLWLLSSQASMNLETKDIRDDIMQLLRPYVFAAFRYPLFHACEYYFDLAPSNDSCRSVSRTIHGPYPPPRLRPREVPYFGQITRKAQIPSAPMFATLSYFTRLETTIPMIPPHLAKTRDEADASGRLGPTCEDVEYFIHKCQTRFPLNDCRMWLTISRKHETLYQPRLYRPGTLTGRWQGSYILPHFYECKSWLMNLAAPSTFETFGRQPLYITLHEHFCYCPLSRVPCDDAENGMMNAWLPSSCRWVERGDGIEVFDEGGTFKTFYQSFQPSDDVVDKYKDIHDVIITGKTEDRHAAAWGAYTVLGRVRLSDGLIVLSRESLAGLGTTLLRGYVTSSQNLVGRLRGLSTGAEPAEWEEPFSLCKDRGVF